MVIGKSSTTSILDLFEDGTEGRTTEVSRFWSVASNLWWSVSHPASRKPFPSINRCQDGKRLPYCLIIDFSFSFLLKNMRRGPQVSFTLENIGCLLIRSSEFIASISIFVAELTPWSSQEIAQGGLDLWFFLPLLCKETSSKHHFYGSVSFSSDSWVRFLYHIHTPFYQICDKKQCCDSWSPVSSIMIWDLNILNPEQWNPKSQRKILNHDGVVLLPWDFGSPIGPLCPKSQRFPGRNFLLGLHEGGVPCCLLRWALPTLWRAL